MSIHTDVSAGERPVLRLVRSGGIMKVLGRKTNGILQLSLLATILLVLFQNCANKMAFEGVEDLNSMLADKNYAEATVGDADSFPPLKLLFVVDNSGTMGINQINLSTAFSRMFEGSNQTNLAPFNTTAFVVSTSQSIPEMSAASFPRLPSASVESFAGMNQTQFDAHRGTTLSGYVPGDLVGFGLATSNDNGKQTLSFSPAPVALFAANPAGGNRIVTYSSIKNKNASVDQFAEDFRKRVALLNPNLSAIDAGTRRGVLDDVIDQESGLCAVARVLKNNRSFVNPGELLSVVLVSDENDTDPSGRSCVDSIVRGQSGVMYVDGRCEVQRTSLSYRGAVANPALAKCRVDYETGFSYKFDYQIPTTDVSYFAKSMTYDQQQTKVSYYKSSQKYDQLRTEVTYYNSRKMFDGISTPVSYYKKAPTFQIPQTNVKYFKEVESCDIRDGAKVNCTYTYPDFAITLQGASGSMCDTFVSGKLPTGALYTKAGYKPVCTAGTPLARTGACSATDTSIINCQQNYSAITSTQLSGKVLTTCDAFVAGKLPSGAVYTDTGFLPSCGNLIVTADQVGACSTSDLDKQNCRTDYQLAASAAILNGVPGSATCAAFANGRLGASAVYDVAAYLPTCRSGTTLLDQAGSCSTTNTNVTNCRTDYTGPFELTLSGRTSASGCEATFKSQLPSGAVIGNSTYPVTCQDGATLAGKTGSCSATDTNVANCQTVYTPKSAVGLEGSSSSGCASFVSGRLPSGAAYTDAGYLPVCSNGLPKAKSVSDALIFGATPTANVVMGSACGDDWSRKIVTAKGLTVASGTSPTCTVLSLTKSSTTLSSPTQDLSCAVAAWRDTCSLSSGSKRSCVPNDLSAGDKYETAARTVTYENSFTCTTKCSDTSFCADKMGTVADNYFACQTTAASNLTKSTFVMESDTNTAVCQPGQMRVVTNGPYQSTETKKVYVAGNASANNESNALADYIVNRSQELFKESLPILSVFVRQNGDSLGTNGSVGTEYNRLADLLLGKKRSVLSSSDQYALALEDLSSVIRKRLSRSVNFKDVTDTFKIRKVWLRKGGTSDWGAPIDASLWTVNGGTITLADTVQFQYGDEFRIEFW